MDKIQYQYLRYNRYLMNVLGQWPSQNTLERFLISVIFVPTIAAQLIFQGGGLICAIVDMDAFMEGVAPFIISLMCLAKYINFAYNFEQMKDLFMTMQKDWRFYMKYEYERNILYRYYEDAKKATFGYSATVYGSMLPFMMVPTLLNVANAFGALNATNDKPLLFRVDYFIDVETYYYPLLIHSYFATIGYITIVVAMDTINLLYVQHGCALCTILGYYLENIVKNDDLEINLIPNPRDDEGHHFMKECVKLHNHVINYANKLERTNTISHCFQLILNMIGISFTGFQAATKMDMPEVALRYACFTICLTFVVFLESWPGQQLADHTDRIREYATSGKWYQTSLSTRTDLSIMLMRCLKPIQLTAGKIYVLNLENFSRVVRTSFSYFTVLCSVQ
ncbi:odorant receptor 49a-like isoform X3 [Vespa velutina]|uniref:odorant receptor 49a-like isoform X3 n=1 Tax=Vespa velutina TaxID=202808 RepID=UPI001FB3D7C0|nr:odorant receptor 49a-like isoform X3 [Vespa velutina]